MSVRWIDGPQTYDAEIEQHGAYVSENFYPVNAFLEVTSVVHPNEYLSRELLDTKGSAFGLDGLRRLSDGSIESVPVGYTNMEFIGTFARFALDQVAKKEKKRYPPHTTLIVQCALNLPYLPAEWSELVERIQQGLPASQFKEIYLYDPVAPYSYRVFPKQRSADGAGPA